MLPFAAEEFGKLLDSNDGRGGKFEGFPGVDGRAAVGKNLPASCLNVSSVIASETKSAASCFSDMLDSGLASEASEVGPSRRSLFMIGITSLSIRGTD
jgi:hypothetical protein